MNFEDSCALPISTVTADYPVWVGNTTANFRPILLTLVATPDQNLFGMIDCSLGIDRQTLIFESEWQCRMISPKLPQMRS
jgi:hypothetical protein